MVDTPGLQDVWRYLQDLQVSVNYDELKSAFSSKHGVIMASWVDEFLSPETVLTKEELAAYSAIQDYGEREPFSNTDQFSEPLLCDDQELRDAIEQLKRSTVATEKQSTLLRTQQEALASLVKGNIQNDKSRAAVDPTHYRAWTTESEKMAYTIDEMTQIMNAQILDLDMQRDTVVARLNHIAEEILRADDKLLSNVEKLSAGLDTSRQTSTLNVEQIRDLCARLIKHTVEAIRARLDCVYLKVSGNSSNDNSTNDDGSELAALREELESLYAEILPVAQMSVEQQFLQPMLQAIGARDKHGKERSVRSLQYISSCLSFLIGRLQAFSKEVENYQFSRVTTLQLISTIKSELSLATARAPGNNISADSHQNRFNGQLGPSATSLIVEHSPEQQVLDNLGVSLPEPISNYQELAFRLVDALEDRANKLQRYEQNLQESKERAITIALHDAHSAFQSLRGSILSETRYNKIQLADEENDEAVALMIAEVEELKQALDSIDAEKLKERDSRREIFVERWMR